MSRLDWSLNSAIKILVIICLVAHLAVLRNTTQTVICDLTSPLSTATSSVLPSGVSAPVENQTNCTNDKLFHQSPSRPKTTRDGQGRTFNITDHIENDYYPLLKRPINAFDLKTQYPVMIPLEELINTDPDPSCRPGNAKMSLVESVTHFDHSTTHPPGRKVPKIVHVTSKTRCMPPIVHDSLDRWKFPGYNFYVHDDAAVERLLFETYWPEFPHLNLIRPCMISGAAMADLWRFVVVFCEDDFFYTKL